MSPERGCLPEPSGIASSRYTAASHVSTLTKWIRVILPQNVSSHCGNDLSIFKRLGCTLYICKQSVSCLCNTVLDLPRQDGGRKDVMFFFLGILSSS